MSSTRSPMMPKTQVIYLHRAAPPKPAPGDSCNGCGVCCAVETCPVSRVFLLQWRGPCRALQWQPDAQRYVCRMMTDPKALMPALPQPLVPLFRRMVSRWIATGIGCDSDAEIVHDPSH